MPFYREHWDAAGVTPEAIRSLDDLDRLPVVSKREMQAAGPEAITSTAFDPTSLVSARTSGSSGRPFTVRFDPRWLSVRRAMFARALMAAGYRPGRRLLMLTGGDKRQPPAWYRWRYASYKEEPARLLDELERFRPFALYGWVTPLRELARHALETGRPPYHRPSVIVTTAETLDAATRRLLHETFGARVFELYGLTEMGTAAAPCPSTSTSTGVFHLAEDVCLTEFRELPEGTAEGGATPLVMTNLELYATPFIRFDTGDLGVPRSASGGERCSCGRSLARIERIEGRLVDSIRLGSGRMISPFQLTIELERIPGIDRYQVIQEDTDRFTVRYEGSEKGADEREQAARRALAAVVGPRCEIRTERRPNLDPPPGQKFRVVESRLRGESA
ncbi:MAG: hypothetical protein O7A09_05705 [Proteobacteria bacterium]|nr:hypothetical protein [Pseudomonadota bacterium]